MKSFAFINYDIAHGFLFLSMDRRRIGMLGGGQLGRMLWECSLPWDVDLRFLDRSEDFPAGRAGARIVRGDFRNYDDVLAFGRECDVIGIEIEQVNADALIQLEKEGVICIPSAAHVAFLQDKLSQKQLFEQLSVPSAPFENLASGTQRSTLEFPYFLKLCKGGYDGYGIMKIRDEAGLQYAFSEPCFAEVPAQLAGEFAIMLARDCNGATSFFPAVAMDFDPESNMVKWVRYPSGVAEATEAAARAYLATIAEHLNYVGVLAAEYFLLQDGSIWLNELAPRPHNSMHWTQDGCDVSQFVQYLRILCGKPPASVKVRCGAALMLNINGEAEANGYAVFAGVDEVLSESGTFLHLYGKTQVKPFRKMGHLNIIGENQDEIVPKANKLLHLLRVKGEAG